MSTCNQTGRKSERGAALILVLFASLLILACALMLLLDHYDIYDERH